MQWKIYFIKVTYTTTKNKLCITYLRHIVMFACETWASTKCDKGKQAIFERKILRKIYGPDYNRDSEILEK